MSVAALLERAAVLIWASQIDPLNEKKLRELEDAYCSKEEEFQRAWKAMEELHGCPLREIPRDAEGIQQLADLRDECQRLWNETLDLIPPDFDPELT